MAVRALLLVALLVGCEQPLFGPPTEAECPPAQTLTYENFGAKFMEDYCTECHDSNKFGEDRQGATSFHDFDTLFGIQAVSEHIDLTTASGPAGTNDSMPPEGQPAPTAEERKQLGEWIACEMPRQSVEVTRTIGPGQEIVGVLTGPAKGQARLRFRSPVAELGWQIEETTQVLGQGQKQTEVDYTFIAPSRSSWELTLSNSGTSEITVDVQLVLYTTMMFAWQ